MTARIIRTALTVATPVAFILLAAGCGARGGALPDSVTIELPDGTTTQATLGSGVASLADTSWEFYLTAAPAQGAPFVVISFGPEGNLEAFDDNTLAAEIFGDQIIFDGQRHNTTQQGLSYSAATYGAETSDANGFAFQGILNAFAAGFKVAEGTASASGTFDPDDPNTMTGTFEYAFDTLVELPGVPVGDLEERFGFIAHRVENTDGGATE